MSTPWTILVCYKVFLANEDPRADQVLEESHRVLLERAARISDEEMRRWYLENIPENRQILALWQAAQGSCSEGALACRAPFFSHNSGSSGVEPRRISKCSPSPYRESSSPVRPIISPVETLEPSFL